MVVARVQEKKWKQQVFFQVFAWVKSLAKASKVAKPKVNMEEYG